MLGRTILHYQIVEKIGEGGMGQVYKAWDARLNRHVAIKVLPAGKVQDSSRRERFLREARAASALNHPNIVTIYDIVSENDDECLIMEFIAGQTIAGILDRGPMQVSRALEIGAQIADALATAHEAGIVHRDLKPGNVMVTSGGHVKLLDFGLAKLVQTESSIDSSNSSTSDLLTLNNTIIGTPRYMSPEQAEGKKLDARSDIFTFGVVFYEMLTGQFAFQAPTTLSTLTAVLRDEPRPIAEFVPELREELVLLINHCIRKNPEQRYQRMRSVHEVLRTIAGRPAIPDPIRPKPQAAPSKIADETVLYEPPAAAPVVVGKTKLGQRVGLVALAAGLVIGALVLRTTWKKPAEPQVAPVVTETSQPPASPPVTAPPLSPLPSATVKPAPPIVAPAAAPGLVTLKDSTPVQLSLAAEITDEAEKGDRVSLTALQDVVVNGVVLIAKGAPAQATIAEGSRRKMLVKKSEATLLFDSVETVDGMRVRLRESTQHRADRKPRAAGRLISKNGRNSIPTGAEYVAYIDGDVQVSPRIH